MRPIRTSEPDVLLTTLPDPVWVECPRCSRPARIARKPHKYRAWADATLSCAHCAYQHRSSEAFRATSPAHLIPTAWHPRCERCGGDKFDFARAQVIRHGGAVALRTRCGGCNRTNTFPARGSGARVRDGHDHWFGLPLVLKADYRSHLVWAYNLEHIDLLEGWIKADLRERSLHAHYMTMAARLPAWMKAAHARNEVLKALAKMRDIAASEGLS